MSRLCGDYGCVFRERVISEGLSVEKNPRPAGGLRLSHVQGLTASRQEQHAAHPDEPSVAAAMGPNTVITHWSTGSIEVRCGYGVAVSIHCFDSV
jgi:hypothetical protein